MYAEKTKKVLEYLVKNDGAIIEKWFIDLQPVVAGFFQEKQPDYERWLEIIASCSGTHWELFIQIMRESPELLRLIALDEYQNFLELCRAFARIDLKTALAVCRKGKNQFAALKQEARGQFLEHCWRLFAQGWEEALAYFEHYPSLLRVAGKEGRDWDEAIFRLAGIAPALLKEFLSGAAVVLEALSARELEQWLQTGLNLEKSASSKIAALYLKTFVQLVPLLSVETKKNILIAWTNEVLHLSRLNEEAVLEFLLNSPRAAKMLEGEDFIRWWEIGAKVTQHQVKAGSAYYRNSISVARETSMRDLERWAIKGLEIEGNERRLNLYYCRQSRESQEALKEQQQTLFLEKELKGLLTLAEALFDVPVLIREREVLPKDLYKGQPDLALCDGLRVYLPEKINTYPDRQLNYKLYKMALLHQLAHLSTGACDLWLELGAGKDQGSEPAGQLYGYVTQLLLDREADYFLLHRSPGLIRDFRILLENFLPLLHRLAERGSAEAAFSTLLYRSLPVEPHVARPGMPAPLQIKQSAAKELAVLLAAGDVPRYLQLFATYRVPYRGWFVPELLEAAKLVSSYWRVHGKQLTAEKLISWEGNRFFSGKEVTFYRYLLDRLIALHRREAEDGPSRIAFYDEWDWTLDDYKKDWCRIREYLLQPTLNARVDEILEEYRSLVTTMKRYFAMLRPDRVKKLKRQPEGDQLDLDAVVEAMVEKKVGLADAANLYVRRDKRMRDVAVAFLLDCSGSTDEVVGDGKTILDLEREAVIIMAEALELLGDIFAVYAFSSNGRHEVDFYIVKDFGEAYTPDVRRRLGRLESANMTRLAAAIRHVLTKMQGISTAVRLLFILSDGRPFDMDYRAQEGEEKKLSRWLREDESLYPQADTRMALWEAKASGVTPFCITVDRHAKEYMDRIFGRVGYVLINNVDLLPVKLPEIYRRLTT